MRLQKKLVPIIPTIDTTIRADPARRAHGGEGSRRPTIDTTTRADPARRASKTSINLRVAVPPLNFVFSIRRHCRFLTGLQDFQDLQDFS